MTASATSRDNSRMAERVLAYAVLAIAAIYTLLPLFYVVVSATKTNRQLFSTFGLWFAEDINLIENIRDLFAYQDGIFSVWLMNSAIYAIAVAAGTAVISTAAGYALSKFRFRGRNVVFALIVGSVMVPSAIVVIPLFLMFAGLGVTDTMASVILPSIVSPLGVYLMKVFIDQAVPDELLDAARIDGASELRIFVTVVLRLASPGVVTVLLLAFTGTWNNFFLPLVMLSDPALMPMTVGLQIWNDLAGAGSGGQALFSIVIAGAFVGVLPVVAMFILLQRFWQGGLASGAVK